MKKIIFLFLTILAFSVFGQEYLTKTDAKQGIIRSVNINQNNYTVQSRDVQAVLFSEDFESGDISTWTLIDADGDTHNWAISSVGSHTGTKCVTSASWSGSPLTPDNYLVSPAIDLTNATGTLFLEWYVRAQDQSWPSEIYRVLISTSGTAVSDFTEIYPDETVQAHGPDGNEYWKRTVDVSAYAGQTIHVAFEHHNVTDMFRINLDDISIYENNNVDAGITAIVAPSNETSCSLSNAENITITVFNYGGTAITEFDASYSVNGGSPITEHITGVNIAPASAADVTFSQTADLSTLGYYAIEATVNLTGDTDTSNNSFTHHVTNGDASLEIEVHTDSNGGQSWELVDSNGTTIAQHSAYQWDITEITTICLIDNDCYTFHWHGGTSNTVTLTYNGTQVDQTTATGDYDIFGIGSNCSAIDVQLENLDIPSVVVAGNVDIKGKVKNVGSDAITSFDVVYTVDGTSSATYTASGLNIATNGTYDFTHDVPYVAVAGSHSISVTISNVNGGTPAETNIGNNTLTQALSVATNATQKLPLYEEFTSSTCSPCANLNGNYFTTTFLNNNSGHYSLVKYQMNWPAPGDAYYTAEGGVRKNYYGINSVPSLRIDGPEGTHFDTALLQQDLDAAYATPAYFEMSAIHTINVTDEKVYVKVDVNPFLTGNFTLHCAVVEKTTTGNVGNNGETEFHNVMMKMVPDASGTPTTFAADTPKIFYIEASLNGTHIEDWNDLEVVVFLQNDSDKKVMQSTVSVEDANSIEDVVFNQLNIYPTPTQNVLHISNAAGMQISIFSLNGSLLYQKDDLMEHNNLNLPNLTNGVYLAKFTKDGKTAVRKLIISK